MKCGLAVHAKSWTSAAQYRCVFPVDPSPLSDCRRRRTWPTDLSVTRWTAAGRADDEFARRGNPHVVDAVVGVELGVGVELVRVPARILQHAHLREPLGDEVVVVHVAGACKRTGNLARPFHFDIERFLRLHRERQRYRHHRAIGGIAVVGREKPCFGSQVGPAVRFVVNLRAEPSPGTFIDAHRAAVREPGSRPSIPMRPRVAW